MDNEKKASSGGESIPKAPKTPRIQEMRRSLSESLKPSWPPKLPRKQYLMAIMGVGAVVVATLPSTIGEIENPVVRSGIILSTVLVLLAVSWVAGKQG